MDVDFIMWLQTIFFFVVAGAAITLVILEAMRYYVKHRSPIHAEIMAEEALRKIKNLERKMLQQIDYIDQDLIDLKELVNGIRKNPNEDKTS